MESLSDIAVFSQVVESGSFTAAAERLELSKSVVSKYVTRLEERLGVRLLNRTTRRLSLTETGHILFERSQPALQALQEASDAVTRLQESPRGTLRLNLPMSFAVLHVAPALAEFGRLFPDINVELNLDDRKVDLVEGGFDAAIRIAELPDSSYVARRLARCRHVVCASPEYLEHNGVPKVPADLARHRIVQFRYQSSASQWHFRAANGESESVAIDAAVQLNNSLAIREAVLNGAGITRTPTFVVGADIREGHLMPLLGQYECPSVSIFVVYPERRFLLPKVRAFVDFMVERIANPPYWDEGGTLPSRVEQ